MYNFISLNVKCPHCSNSFMDEENLVDNQPSIKLNIKIGDNSGIIRLSSIYGSYNYICDFEIQKDSIANFSCTHCNGILNTEEKCSVCNAPMVTFVLDIGGKVTICSRAGCKNHLVEFEDLSQALTKLYQDYGYQSKILDQEVPIPREEKLVKQEVDEDKEIIETGTYLNAYCPYCKHSLNEEDMLKLKIINEKNEEGYVFLSPYLNVFSSKSTIFLQEDKVVNDIKCPHCEESLVLKDKSCELCGSPVAVISISARTKLINFYICSKKGCRWHGLSEDDINEIKLEDSMEW